MINEQTGTIIYQQTDIIIYQQAGIIIHYKTDIMIYNGIVIQVNLATSKSKGMAKYLQLSEVRRKQNVTSPQYDVHVQFLQDILLQYMCSQTVPTENRIEIKTKEFHFSLFYFLFNYVVDCHNATALARDKQYCRNGDFLNYW